MMKFLKKLFFKKRREIPKHPEIVVKEVTWTTPHPTDPEGKKPVKVRFPNGLVIYSTWYRHPWMNSSGKIKNNPYPANIKSKEWLTEEMRKINEKKKQTKVQKQTQWKVQESVGSDSREGAA